MKQRSVTSPPRSTRWHLVALLWALWVVLFAALTLSWATAKGAWTAPMDTRHVIWLSVAVMLIGLTSWRLARLVNARFGRSESTRAVALQAIFSSLFWALVLSVPWLLSGRIAVTAPHGWVLAAALWLSSAVAFVPLTLLNGLLVRHDFARQCTAYRYVGYACRREFDVRRYPRAAEFALWSLLLSPVYPWLRATHWRSAAVSYAWLMLLAGGLLAIGMVGLHFVGAGMRWDDWTAVMHWRAFPIWRYVPGLLALALVCLCGRRLLAAIARRIFADKCSSRRPGKRWMA